jgi:hypothetical protein
LSYGPETSRTTQTITREAEPEAFWRAVCLTGGLPLVLGLGAVFVGRRMTKR